VVLWRLSIGCQNYISKYSNPNDTDISISTQHTNIIGFSCTISQKYSNQQIFKYSKKNKNLKEQRKTREYHGMRRDVQKMPKSRKKIQERNIQNDKNKRKMQCCADGKEIKGLASGRGTHSSRWSTIRLAIGRATCVWIVSQVHPDASH